jgi:hypothetical protein
LLFTFVDFPPSDACSGIGQRPGHPWNRMIATKS